MDFVSGEDSQDAATGIDCSQLHTETGILSTRGYRRVHCHILLSQSVLQLHGDRYNGGHVYPENVDERFRRKGWRGCLDQAKESFTVFCRLYKLCHIVSAYMCIYTCTVSP